MGWKNLWVVAWLLVGSQANYVDRVYCQVTESPPDLVLLTQKARAALGTQEYDSARALLEEAVQAFPQQAGPWYLLGFAHHAQKDYEAALSAYQKSTQMENPPPNAFYNLACVQALLGRKEAAFASLEAAIQAGFADLGRLQADPELESLRSDPRFESYQPVWLEDSDLFVEPSRILHQWFGEKAGDQFGWTARRIGDLDGDSVTDFITTAPTFGQGSGRVYLYSSRTGNLLQQFTGKRGARLGNSAVGIGDLNGDGIPDVAIGAPNSNQRGAVIIGSGLDGSILMELAGETDKGQFGYEVSETGDLNGDGTPDFLVGEIAGNGKELGSGRVVVYSGKDGTLIFELLGEQAGDGFGNAAAVTHVAQEDFLLAIGAPNAGDGDRGKVYVYQIHAGKPQWKFSIESDQNSQNLGQMFLSFPGDVDSDGTPDLYASDFGDRTAAPGGGKVVMHSGATGEQLIEILGRNPGEGLGTSPSDAGDVDGDGIGDLVIGAWQNGEGAPSGGKVYLYSTQDSGKLLRTWTCRQAGDTLGFDACGIGDVNGDGHVDFLLTSAWCGKNGPKSGRVMIVSGEPLSGDRGKVPK